jgi:hypothetical protein
MRHTMFIATALASALASGACAHGSETQTTTITGAPMQTSGPAVGEPELSRRIGALSERIAHEVCSRELRCGRESPACVEDVVAKAQGELATWNCSPAAARTRIEECLAGIESESCELDLSAPGHKICSANAACGANATLVSPGRAASERER